jgi:phosphatidylserine/phosphatidylglycerophosphate/cardiolipin synthase-like enzyme
MRPRPLPSIRRAALLLAALLAAPVAPRAVAAGAGARPITLVETRPVETRLGNPEFPASLDVWLDMIRGARERLDLEHFYCSDWPDEPLRPVLDALGAAAARGVRVRLLLDRRMHATYPEPADSLGRVPGIEVRTIDFRTLAGGVQHAKCMLADGETVFLGSQNLDWRALRHIHELGVRIREPRLAAVFQEVFDLDWAAAGRAPGDTVTADTLAALRAGVARGTPPELPLTVVQAPGDTVRVWPSYSPRGFIPDPALWDLDALVRLLDGARREVVAQVLSYAAASRGSDDPTLDRALRRAAARGVRVRLIVSDWQGGAGLDHLRGLAAVPNVEVRIASVPEWSGGYIPYARVEHCKFAVVDGRLLWIGTSNWSPDYFHGSRNLAVTLDNRRLAAQARRTFEVSWLAPGAKRLAPDVAHTPREHGEEAPAGRRAYGR